eukprot:506494_1
MLLSPKKFPLWAKNVYNYYLLIIMAENPFSFRGIISISLYMVTGPSLILMNNYVLNDIDFKYPIMLSSLGIFTSAIIVHTLVLLKYITIRTEIKDIISFKFLISRIGILALLQALTLNFGNLVYTHLSVSLIQMLKAFTPVITMLLTFMTKQATPNKQLIYSISLLSIGTLITSVNVSDTDASIIGFLIMFAAESSEALKLVLSQKLMQGITVETQNQQTENTTNDEEKEAFITGENNEINESNLKTNLVNVKFTVFESLYYYAPMTFLCQCCLSLPMELGEFREKYDKNINILVTHWMKFVICGCLGFGVNMASFLVTKITSGLYLKALGTFRNICLVGVSMLLFHEIVESKQCLGYVVSLAGFMYYNYIKLQESKK